MTVQSPSPKSDAVSRALLAGFIASTAMLYLFAFAFWVCMQALRWFGGDLTTFGHWLRHLTYNSLVDSAHGAIAPAMLFHLLVGMVLAIVYALWFEPHLSGGGWRRGLLFSLLPWLLSVVVFFPLAGAGFFGVKLGAGPLPAIGNLILHLCYGLILGVAYGPVGDMVTMPQASEENVRYEHEAMAGSTRRAASGLVIGILLGALAGNAFVGSAAHTLALGTVGMSPMFVLLAGICLCGALGCLLGAFVGLPTAATMVRRDAMDRK